MPERDADKMAGKPERGRKVGGGTAEGTVRVHQVGTACDEHVGEKTLMTMEEVVCRKNMLAAYQQVVGNKGAPGVDGITVDALKPLLQARWEAIREELLGGTYHPSPVRKVEIPKPGGKGVRMLGIPTV